MVTLDIHDYNTRKTKRWWANFCKEVDALYREPNFTVKTYNKFRKDYVESFNCVVRKKDTGNAGIYLEFENDEDTTAFLLRWS
jgi:hypothetical protein